MPVCSDFCDNWYDACKADQICVENVLEDYNFTVHQENFCPANKTCKTYEAMYGNGKNLCEKMWAGSYNYTEANADYSNCLRMDGSQQAGPPTTTVNGSQQAESTTTMLGSVPYPTSKGFVSKAGALFLLVLFVVPLL